MAVKGEHPKKKGGISTQFKIISSPAMSLETSELLHPKEKKKKLLPWTTSCSKLQANVFKLKRRVEEKSLSPSCPRWSPIRSPPTQDPGSAHIHGEDQNPPSPAWTPEIVLQLKVFSQ